MDLQECRELLSGWLDDKDNGYFTVSDCNSYLNLAQKECQKILIQAFQDKWIKCAQTTTFVYQREYQLPSDFRKLNRLELVLSGNSVQTENVVRLDKITRNQQDNISPQNVGTPVAYFFENDKLMLWPAPDQQLVLRLNYTYTVADMVNDTDVPDIPDEHQEFMVMLAQRTAMIRDGRAIAELENKIANYTKSLKEDAQERNVDQPRTVVQTLDDDYESIW